MAQKIQPVVILDDANIGGSFEAAASMFGVSDPNDLRLVSMKNAILGEFDARGKKLTLQFFEGARFKSLKVDETTQVYDDEGHLMDAVPTVVESGEYQMLDVDPNGPVS